ncbi:MAG: hypothetical protein Hyperionvirus1_79 [Hyperionvirus sp.]|uniref:Uncharacterized protein n=1 Tax=Hyperionvirus sp. TaxID=2487770 RepID=A0A3G5A5H5_9VIRU|nr:MAG: hypothetical protein Hyperionvirus1_79 [Hyperionvirus sp.]
MAAAGSLDEHSEKKVTQPLGVDSVPQYTVIWDARGQNIAVLRELALRSDTYRAYCESSFCKDKFYINWSPEDVHKVIDLLRDSPGLIHVNLHSRPSTLAAYLMIDVASYQKYAAERKEKCLAVLKEIAKEIRRNPGKYRLNSVALPNYYTCESLIPATHLTTELSRYLSEVPFSPSEGKWYRWEWEYIQREGLFMKKVPA